MNWRFLTTLHWLHSFQKVFVHFVSLCHILVIFSQYFELFQYYDICYGALWSVILGVLIFISHYGEWKTKSQSWDIFINQYLIKIWCFWTLVLEKTLESPLDCKEIQPVNHKESQSWIFTGRTDAEAEMPILWPPAVKNWLIWKEPGAGKDWRQDEKGTTEDEMVGWHHQLNGHGFE